MYCLNARLKLAFELKPQSRAIASISLVSAVSRRHSATASIRKRLIASLKLRQRPALTSRDTCACPICILSESAGNVSSGSRQYSPTRTRSSHSCARAAIFSVGIFGPTAGARLASFTRRATRVRRRLFQRGVGCTVHRDRARQIAGTRRSESYRDSVGACISRRFQRRRGRLDGSFFARSLRPRESVEFHRHPLAVRDVSLEWKR
jgi:hypothetical protein